MEYLPRANPGQNDGWEVPETMNADGKSVVVLGGGDTGADCVGTAHRQGAKQVVQIELLPRPPEERPPGNQWPDQPQTYEKSYSQEEGGVEEYCVDTQQLHDTDGDGVVDELRADRVEWEQGEDGWEKEVVEEDMRVEADMVLIAAGFEGPESTPFDPLGLEMTDDGTFETENHQTSVDGVFAAGDANSGPSLIVWAIGDGRDAARDIDEYLMGGTDLPASLETANEPVVSRR
jgi:glutamate synthase (NADPH/NADH) small chain